jgi:Bacterial Ig-like domain (group 3)
VVGTPPSNVSFYDGAVLLGSSPLLSGTASFTATLVAGANNITAAYSGDANYVANTSTALTESVLDFNLTLGGASASQTVEPSLTATFAFNLSPLGGLFSLPITLSATGLPPGATVTFTPQTLTLGASPTNFTMAIQTAATSALQNSNRPFRTGYGSETIALSLLLLPFSRSLRRKVRAMRLLTLCTALLLSFAAIGGLTGCGSSSGFFGQVQQTYTINVVATATGPGQNTLQHSSPVTLTVQ